jgi:hypothetical protein
MSKYLAIALCAATMTIAATAAIAESGKYLGRTEFLIKAFGTSEPSSDVIWMNDELRKEAVRIMGHPVKALRVRYWFRDDKTAWIIDEIGKEKPITLGIVIKAAEIDSLQVLEFRESRGWEIRYPFFTDQFARLGLSEKKTLNGRIDGISGATLSVRAATKSATLALALDDYRRQRTQTAAATP